MRFLVHSSANKSSIEAELGGVDYSYYFVLKSYLPLLAELGTVTILDTPLSADNEDQWLLDDDTWYLSFTPPNKVDLSSSAHILPVFAWEFGTLPDEPFINDSDDWHHILSQVPGAITHSTFTVDVTRASLGDAYPIASIPAPIWDSLADMREARSNGVLDFSQLQFDCTVIDSADFSSVNQSLVCFDDSISYPEFRAGRSWDGAPIQISFADVSQRPVHWGFNRASGGQLQFTGNQAWLALPSYVSGPVLLELSLISNREAAGTLIRVSLAGSSAVVRLEVGLLKHRLYLEPEAASNILSLSAVATGGNAHPHHTVEIEDICLSRAEQDQPGAVATADLIQQETVYWYGVNHPELWGRWTTDTQCGLMLPHSVQGTVRIQFEIVNSLIPMGSEFSVQLGEQTQDVLLSKLPQTVDLVFENIAATDHLALIRLQTAVFDESQPPRELGIGISGLQIDCQSALETLALDNEKIDYLLDEEVEARGFHTAEEWGRWTSTEISELLLPGDISGNITFSIDIANNPHRSRSPVQVEIDGQIREFKPRRWRKSYQLQFTDLARTNSIMLRGCKVQPVTQSNDTRALGLGLSKLRLSRTRKTNPATTSTAQPPSSPIVYTIIFNPLDGRKNWPDILNAFVVALREQPDAVLIAKVVHNDLQLFIADFCTYFVQLAPFKCRIIFVHGYLPEQQYRGLIQGSHFIVSASRGEGQCLPLMEYMSSGVPALAPDNSAMADYVNNQNALVVKSSIEPTNWPQDSRLSYKTTWARINWESLFEAFIESYDIAKHNTPKYRAMSQQAIASLREYCSLESGRKTLTALLQQLRQSKE